MEDNRIQNAQLSSSSERDGDYGPQDGRLHNPRAWRPLNHYLHWLQVDFWRRVKVTEILTQGRSDSDPEEWYASYYIDYSLNAVNFIDYAPYGTEEVISHFEAKQAKFKIWAVKSLFFSDYFLSKKYLGLLIRTV